MAMNMLFLQYEGSNVGFFNLTNICGCRSVEDSKTEVWFSGSRMIVDMPYSAFEAEVKKHQAEELQKAIEWADASRIAGATTMKRVMEETLGNYRNGL